MALDGKNNVKLTPLVDTAKKLPPMILRGAQHE